MCDYCEKCPLWRMWPMRRKVLFRWNRTPVREIGKYSQTAHAGDFSNQLYESCIGWWLRGTSVSLFHISILKWKEVIWAIIYIKNLWKYWDCNYLTVTQMLMTLLMICFHFCCFPCHNHATWGCKKGVNNQKREMSVCPPIPLKKPYFTRFIS